MARTRFDVATLIEQSVHLLSGGSPIHAAAPQQMEKRPDPPIDTERGMVAGTLTLI